jgi:O-methyltransferase
LGGWPAGGYSTKGVLPEIQDDRVNFHVGWFTETVPKFKKLPLSNSSKLILHFDADLYSSTLYALCQMNYLKEYYIIFDEFAGDECRALSDYLSAYDSEVTFLAKTFWRNYPGCVLGLMINHNPET